MYRVQFLRKAVKELSDIDPLWQRRIKKKVELLASDPNLLKHNIKRLKGIYHDFARLRVGNNGIIFQVKAGELLIHIIRIIHRRSVY